MYDWIGWIATSCFTVSYFVKSQITLMWLQAVAALIWLSYGVLIQSRPVIVANVIVSISAIVSAIRLSRKKSHPHAVGDAA